MSAWLPLICRQTHEKRSAFARFTARPYLAAMCLDNRTCKEEPKAGTGRAPTQAAVHPIEAVKDMGEFMPGNTDSLIRNIQHNAVPVTVVVAVFRPSSYPYRAAIG